MHAYPLTMSFKLLALNPQVKITDASGQTVMYVKQKALSFKEDIKIFADEAQQRQLYQLKSRKAIAINMEVDITTPEGLAVGSIRRPGMRSAWKATYNILDAAGSEVGLVHEENPWIKVLESFLSEVPFVNMFINPAYLVDWKGQTVLYLKKEASLTEGKFTLSKRGEFSDSDERLLLPAVVQAIMLERMRG